MKPLKCAVCGLTKSSLLFKTKDYDSGSSSDFRVVKCRNCGLVYLDPQPSKEYLDRFYVFNYYGNQSFFHSLFLLINDFIMEHRARSLIKKGKGKVLDVGCGDGNFLRCMERKGWEVYGIEPSASGSKITKSKIKGHIFNGTLNQAKFKDKFFDAITIAHVLEHVDLPGSMVLEAGRILKDDGVLVISVPNIASMQAKIGRDKWFHLDIPRHLYHFSPKTLSLLLEKNGFVVDKIKHFSLVYNVIGFLQTFMNMAGIRFNFLHHLIKRVDRQKNYFNASFVINFLMTAIFSIVLVVPSLILSLAESLVGNGATMTVFARKK